MKVIIAGGRDFSDYELLKKKCDSILSNKKHSDIIIFSGCARGADDLGESYALERDYKLELFCADWKTYGKSAGMIRNNQMAEVADALIAFWDGESHGTKHIIEIATKKGLLVRIIKYNI